VIHKIKALYDEGRGLSIRAIARELGVSRNTVRKYLAQSPAGIVFERAQPRRHRLDEYRPFIGYLLRRYPKLSAVKVALKLREKLGEIDVSDRTLRRYLQQVRRLSRWLAPLPTQISLKCAPC